jgi:hypothetical protein
VLLEDVVAAAAAAVVLRTTHVMMAAGEGRTDRVASVRPSGCAL